jgi:putative restriction endonuclease
LRLPALWERGRSGVDSAHILPDSEFDLNHVANGLCLCKLHHWAFDEGLIEIRHDPASGYSIAIPDEARTRAAGPPLLLDLMFLLPHIGPITDIRLPWDPAQRPNPECLRRLHELLYP